ncbi:MAG: methyltransferase domain-containing protein [Hyphomicrobiaceae bacterium]|nr:methyltransferase domain-containing protein [Hyphomicrobiaceae bacterium]
MQHDAVKDYYGKVLQSSDDLKTSACCTADSLPAHIRPLAAKVHTEVSTKYYGCGLVAPSALTGLRILDLGSGSGRDAYILAQLVGETGEVVGVDMTDEQLAVAREHVEWHARAFGYAKPNVRFLNGYIETLADLKLEPASFDVVVSNCVINLSLDKPAVLKGAYDLLKPGGELYFSDVYADRRIPAQLASDPVLYGECLSGALYWNDFLPMAKRAGFLDPRLVTSRPLEITNAAVQAKLGAIKFYSATYRLFKLDQLESSSEDYGHAVVYKGTIPEQPDAFELDAHNRMARGKPTAVCGNTWRMLSATRFAPHFEFSGDYSTHRGAFMRSNSPTPLIAATSTPKPAKACC